MPDPFHQDLAGLLVSSVTALDAAISIADATAPDLPLIYVNPAFERMTGYRADVAVGRNARFMQGPDTDPGTVHAVGQSLAGGQFTRARVVNYRADGTPFWIDLHISPVHDEAGAVIRFAAVQLDVTAEVRAHQEAAHAATRDPLTGLMNRISFGDELEREMARAHRTGAALAVLFLDIDAFKAVNDTHGHLVGDGYLVHVAECLRQRLRGQDAAARVGGDEFIAFLGDLPGDGSQSTAHVVADLHRALSEPFTIDGATHTTNVSIGTALYPRDGRTVQDLIATADANMYQHKRPRPG